MTKRNRLLKTTLAVLLSTSMVAIGEPGQASAITVTQGKQVIKAGEKYLGTPYKYASSRSRKSTTDCSEFTMWAYKEGAKINLGKGGVRYSSMEDGWWDDHYVAAVRYTK